MSGTKLASDQPLNRLFRLKLSLEFFSTLGSLLLRRSGFLLKLLPHEDEDDVLDARRSRLSFQNPYNIDRGNGNSFTNADAVAELGMKRSAVSKATASLGQIGFLRKIGHGEWKVVGCDPPSESPETASDVLLLAGLPTAAAVAAV